MGSSFRRVGGEQGFLFSPSPPLDLYVPLPCPVLTLFPSSPPCLPRGPVRPLFSPCLPFLFEQAEERALLQEQTKILRRPATKISLSLKKKGSLF